MNNKGHARVFRRTECKVFAGRPAWRIRIVAGLIMVCATAAAEDPLPDFAGVIHTRKLAPVSGRRAVLAILWDPQRPQHPAPDAKVIDELLFGRRPSVVDWFVENSCGKLAVEKAGLLGWYKADKAPEHYWSTNERNDPADADGDGWLNGHVEKWAEAIRKADREFDFAAHDANRNRTLEPSELAILIVIPQSNPFGTNRPPAGRQFPRLEPLGRGNGDRSS